MPFQPQISYPNQMPYYNSQWAAPQQSMNNMSPQYNIIQVNGENGAKAFQMGPNSRVLLLDETAPLVWFVQTDGAGYKTVTPYSITPYTPTQPIDLHTLEERISILEEKINAQPHIGTNKQSRKQQPSAANDGQNPISQATT